MRSTSAVETRAPDGADERATFPAGLKYTTLYDTTLFINQSVHAVYQTLFEAGVLVLIVIMLFLQNFRAMLVPATTVPVTIIGAFAAMALLGFTVNLMTLFALILVHRHRGGRRHRHRRERVALHRAGAARPRTRRSRRCAS